ncbi:MAG: hypothetical protein LUG13_00975 [Oscillospiraceae bacterium]|nr:hypothetical protein [Oscillospiraceae bacterium]
MTTAELKEAILSSVDEIPALEGKVVTGGRLNAKKALDYVVDKYSTTMVYTYEELSAAIADSSISNIWLGNDITLEKTLTINRNLSLFSYGDTPKTLYAAAGLRHFNTTGTDISVNLSDAVLYGGGINNTGGLTLNGGGIYNASSGNISIEGCTISGNLYDNTYGI